MERRIITTQLEENENVLENHLRPQYLSEYIGQEKAKEILKVYIEAAKKRKEALDHVLYMVLRDWERRHLPELLQMRWAVILKLRQVQPLKSQAIWQLF